MTTQHIHRRNRRQIGSSESIVRRFVESAEKPVQGKFRIYSATGDLLGFGDDEFRAGVMAKALGDGARVERAQGRRKRAA